ncbi:MAG: hypothetical protein HRU31_11640 [Rhodobacteraceae bacterium]|nr:hypothetical protein [Paracoccaceae bacterium]
MPFDLGACGLSASNFNAKVYPALSDAGGATLLDLDLIGGTGSVLIEGLSFADVDTSDFLF